MQKNYIYIKPQIVAVHSRHIEDYPFLKDAGEIGELIIQNDWSKTCIGDMDDWPLSLRITLANVLHSAFPMFLFWGDDFLCFYNEAFRPSLGAEGKHPAIGKKAIVVWGEIRAPNKRQYKKGNSILNKGIK